LLFRNSQNLIKTCQLLTRKWKLLIRASRFLVINSNSLVRNSENTITKDQFLNSDCVFRVTDAATPTRHCAFPYKCVKAQSFVCRRIGTICSSYSSVSLCTGRRTRPIWVFLYLIRSLIWANDGSLSRSAKRRCCVCVCRFLTWCFGWFGVLGQSLGALTRSSI
jgi:hypothetical protein